MPHKNFQLAPAFVNPRYTFSLHVRKTNVTSALENTTDKFVTRFEHVVYASRWLLGILLGHMKGVFVTYTWRSFIAP